MSPKPDPRFDTYIAQSAPFAQPILRHLRALVHRACPEAEETIKWSAPTFTLNGKLLCGLAAFKAHAAFNFWHQGLEKIIKAERGSVDGGMGLLGRITKLEDLPDDKTLARYIQTAAELVSSGAPARPKPKPKKAIPTPADLTAALKKNKKAAERWENFSPSCRREYLEWITEAKRPETRAQRIATTVEWSAAGKHRNWKYMNC